MFKLLKWWSFFKSIFIFINYPIYIWSNYEGIYSCIDMECVWSLQRVTFYRLYLRIFKATHPMGFIWESPKAYVTWESLKWHVSQALHKNPESDKTHKLYSRITTATHTMVSNEEGTYSKGFSQRKEAHPTSSTQ